MKSLKSSTNVVTVNSPNQKIAVAVNRGVGKNILYAIGGGLGDQICAEPTLRFALQTFSDCAISVYTFNPELYAHLQFKDSFRYGVDDEKINLEKYNYFTTYAFLDALAQQFYQPGTTHPVDYASLNALRRQLPIAAREILLQGQVTDLWKDVSEKPCVVIHAGKSWPSRTFPIPWWDSLISWVKHFGAIPVLIGTEEGSLAVTTKDCIDLRGKLSIKETIFCLQHSRVLLTNDSAPLHMAASRDPSSESSGKAWIGYLSTSKHPDYLKHFRHGSLGYRMENLSLGGLWQTEKFALTECRQIDLESVDWDKLVSWLPDPETTANWAVKKLHSFSDDCLEDFGLEAHDFLSCSDFKEREAP